MSEIKDQQIPWSNSSTRAESGPSEPFYLQSGSFILCFKSGSFVFDGYLDRFGEMEISTKIDGRVVRTCINKEEALTLIKHLNLVFNIGD